KGDYPQNKFIGLSSQAAGIIGATIGLAFATGILFAWYRYRRLKSPVYIYWYMAQLRLPVTNLKATEELDDSQAHLTIDAILVTVVVTTNLAWKRRQRAARLALRGIGPEFVMDRFCGLAGRALLSTTGKEIRIRGVSNNAVVQALVYPTLPIGNSVPSLLVQSRSTRNASLGLMHPASGLVDECEPIALYFHGGISPYDIYFAVAHAVDNNSTWSEERMTSTVEENFRIWVTPEFGMYAIARIAILCVMDFDILQTANFTDTIRFRISDIVGNEETLWIQVIADSPKPCDPTSTSVDANLSTNTLEDGTTTIKYIVELTLGSPSIESNAVTTQLMSAPASTRGSQQLPGTTLQAGATIESPAEETEIYNGSDRPPSGSPTANADTHCTHGMSTDGALDGSMTAELPDESDISPPLVSSAYHEPINNANSSVGSPSSNKHIRLSNQAIGVIGATTGVALVAGLAFVWYRRQRSVSFKERRTDGYLDI
ncbi:17246_t:CDS:10, partial [Acaulospora colombiana]